MRLLIWLVLLAGGLLGQATLTSNLQNLVVDPSNPAVLWSSSNSLRTLYRSENRGVLWRGIPLVADAGAPNEIRGIVVNPRNGSVVYVAFASRTSPVYKTTDGGRTWTALRTGLPLPLPQLATVSGSAATGTVSLTMLFNTPDTLYLQWNNQLYKTTDGGVSWRAVGSTQTCGALRRIEINQASPSRMYCSAAAGITIATSNDEGATWTTQTQPPSGRPGPLVSGDYTIFSDPTNPDILLVTLFGISTDNLGSRFQADALTRSTDGGRTFTLRNENRGFPVMHRNGITRDVAISGIGPVYTRDMGATFTNVNLPASAAGGLAIDPSNGNVIYTGDRRVSTNAGQAFTALNPNHIIAIDPAHRTEITLEAGTAFSDELRALSLEGDYAPTFPYPLTTSPVPWLRLGNPAETRVVTTQGLQPGTYDTELSFAVPGAPLRLPLRLTVVPKQTPRVRFRVRRVAGSGAQSFSGNGGPATQAGIESFVSSMCFDPAGNLYFSTRDRIRRVTPQGTISSFAGPASDTPTVVIGAAGQGRTSTGIRIACSTDGVFMVANIDNEIRLLRYTGANELFYKPGLTDPTPSFATIRVVNDVLYMEDSFGVLRRDGNAWTRISSFTPVAMNSERDGSLLVANSRQINRLSANGTLTLLGGLPNAPVDFSGDNGPAREASINFPADVIGDGEGNVLVSSGARIRIIYPDGVIQTVGGDGDLINPLPDGALADSGSMLPGEFARDAQGTVFVALDNVIVRLERAAAPPAPTVGEGGVVSLASSQRRVSAGGIFSIYGPQLAVSEALAPSVPLPLRLNGIQVLVNGVAVPLYYVGPLQINAQMPLNQAAGTVRVQVVRDGVASNEVAVEVIAASPDILRYGANRAVAINENGSLNGPGSAARPGQFLVVYFTGVGPVDQVVASGAAAPTNPLARATSSFNATIGGRSANVPFLGLAPGFVGLGQANIQVPEGLAPGDYELVITINGVESNRVLVTVGS